MEIVNRKAKHDYIISDTIEAGIGNNPLPISQFDKIYQDNLGILLLSAIL